MMKKIHLVDLVSDNIHNLVSHFGLSMLFSTDIILFILRTFKDLSFDGPI